MLAPILIRRFRGTAPAVEGHLLPDNAAQVLTNCTLRTGAITPLRETTIAASLEKIGTKIALYRFGENLTSETQYWFHWIEDTNCVRSPTAETGELTIYTQGSSGNPPRWTDTALATSGGGASYPNVSRLLGVPRPVVPTVTVRSPALTSITHTTTTAHAISEVEHGYAEGQEFEAVVSGAEQPEYVGTFTATATGASTFDYTMTADPGADATGTMTFFINGTAEERAYVYTLLDERSKQSMPSDAVIVIVYPGQWVEITGMDTTATWPDDRPGTTIIQTKRIYRTVTGAATRDYRIIGEVVAADTDFVDTMSSTDAQLQEACPSLEWDTPPAALHGVIPLPGKFLAGFEYGTNRVRFSERGFPHAWPITYEQTTKAPVVALGYFGDTVVVLTKGRVYMGAGTDPLSITLRETDIAQSCVSARSVTNGYGGVRYASPDGLIMVGAESAVNLTENLMTRDQWQALNPSSIHGYMLNGAYIGFYSGGVSGDGGFVLDTTQDVGLVFLDFHATGGFVDERQDALFLIISGQVHKFDADNLITKVAHWRSKEWRGRRGNYGAARVLADAYPITFRMYADLAMVYQYVVPDGSPFPLPMAQEASRWAFELDIGHRVTELAIAAAMDELAEL